MAATLADLGLRLSPEKARIVKLAGGAEGFDFLGFHHRVERSEKDDRWYPLKWPSARAMASIRGRFASEPTAASQGCRWRRRSRTSTPCCGAGARTSATGTSGGSSTPSTTTSTSGRDAGQRKHGLHGWQWATRFTQGWVLSLCVDRFSGTVRPTTAHAGRRTISVSRARESRTHGSKGREATRCRSPPGPKGRRASRYPRKRRSATSSLIRRARTPYTA